LRETVVRRVLREHAALEDRAKLDKRQAMILPLASGEAAFRVFSDARRSANLAAVRGSAPYDLVILDYALNEQKNGLETLERIRTLYPRQRGIMVSGHGRAEHEGRALARVPWLPKPYSADALAGIVRRTLDSPVA
jgi:DNA-binding LytR/AlgR family response regulator